MKPSYPKAEAWGGQMLGTSIPGEMLMGRPAGGIVGINSNWNIGGKKTLIYGDL